MRIRGTRRWFTLLAMAAMLLVSLALAGNTGGNCAPIDEEPAACVTDDDCEGVPPVDCVGDWQCVAGACEFECGDPTLPPEGCTSDGDCAAGEYCAFEERTDCCPPETYCAMYLPICQGECRPIEPDPAFECQSDADCEGGFCVFEWDECPSVCTDPSLPCPAVCGPPVVVGSHCEPAWPTECAADSDCPAGYQCQIACDGGVPDCPPGADCALPDPWCYGQCVPIAPPPLNCLSDADCAEGETCVFPADCGWQCEEGEYCPMWDMACLGVCMPVQPPPVECVTDADCPAGMRCELRWDLDAACCPPNAFCDGSLPPCGGGVCVPVEPPPTECRTDADCAPGERCELVYLEGGAPASADEARMPCYDEDGDGWCEPPDTYGVCVPDPEPECWTDADCGPGMMCLLACAGVACAADDPDCGVADPYCWGQCVPRQDGCTSDADCPDGWHCEWLYPAGADAGMPCYDENGDGICDFEDPPYGEGVCVQDPPPVNECTADWDCAADERCEIDWSWCQWDCGPGMDCMPCAGQCVPIKECIDDADCPGGTICDYGDWGGCLPYACDDNDPTCVPPPCLGVCREPGDWTEC